MASNASFKRDLVGLLSSRSHTKLAFSPTNLSWLDVTFVIMLFMLRSFLRLFGYSANADMTKSITLSAPLAITQADLARYAQAISLDATSGINASNVPLLVLLSSFTEPTMLLLLGKWSCPIRPLGAVNVRNRFELLRPDLCQPALLLQASDAFTTAILSPTRRVVKRGVEFDIEIYLNMRSDSAANSSHVVVFKQIFTILQFQKSAAQQRQQQPSTDASDAKPPVSAQQDPPTAIMLPVPLSSSDPSKWAAVCKDYNPLHTSQLFARLSGFPGRLAHGNQVVAKALEVMTKKSADVASTFTKVTMPIWMEVSFRRPVVVPARVGLRVTRAVDERELAGFEILGEDGKVCVSGKVGMLRGEKDVIIGSLGPLR